MNKVDNGAFYHSQEGEVSFFPWGEYGKGYAILPQDEAEIKKSIKTHIIAAAAAAVGPYLVYRLMFPSPHLITLSFIGLVSCLLFLWLRVKSLIKGKKVIREKRTLGEATRTAALALGLKKSLLKLAGSAVFFLLCVVLMFHPKFPSKLVLIIGMAFFGLAAVQSVFLVKYSLTNKK